MLTLLGVREVGHLRDALDGAAVPVSPLSVSPVPTVQGRAHHPRQDQAVQGTGRYILCTLCPQIYLLKVEYCWSGESMYSYVADNPVGLVKVVK